eukprot:TRINITY_DN1621_c0_g2_i3.p1 TRINITY_DN1621_c0_g2~~TRINITY_DN1621_c0_g2_i3.p1  ORF type:complete len:599 (-),score=160.15 TRINITY_DN1621_c0_g2_i3:51-1703(-)
MSSPPTLDEQAFSDANDFKPMEHSVVREKATGLHRWLDIVDDKNRKKGKLHLVIRAEPAEKLDDLTLNSTQFKDLRNSLLRPHVYFSDDHRMRKKLRVYVGTWNVGNAEPSDDLTDWIQTNQRFDIMAIGCQECKYEPGKGYSSCSDDWEGRLRAAVGPKYELIEKKQLWQIAICVFAHKDILDEILDIDSNKEATGVGRVMGNKGGVTVNFKFRHTTFCFVNAHLAAHQDKVEKRNMDVAEITNEMKSGAADLVNNWNYVFWMGDLNYRIEWGDGDDEKKARKPTEEVFDDVVGMIMEKRFEELCANDQLKIEMSKYRVFGNFQEEKVFTFEPTFKVERGIELGYKNQRTPAYCDRILWKSVAGSKIDLHNFKNAKKVLSSDHKPVWADFTVRAFYYTIAHDFDYDSCVCIFSDFKVLPLDPAEREKSKLQKPILQITCPILSDDVVLLDVSSFKKGCSPELNVRFTNLERIKQYFLVIEMRASDTVVGFGMVCLSKILFSPTTTHFQPYPFNILITHGTQGQARLSGSIAFKWGKEVRRKYSKQRLVY